MGDTLTMDDAPVVREIRTLVGGLTDDEAALVRTLTPADCDGKAKVEHLADLVGPACDDPLRRGHGRVRLRHRADVGRDDRELCCWRDASPLRSPATSSSAAHPPASAEPLRAPSVTRRARVAIGQSSRSTDRAVDQCDQSLSRAGRCGRARGPARRPRPAWASRARRPRGVRARPRRPARSRR